MATSLWCRICSLRNNVALISYWISFSSSFHGWIYRGNSGGCEFEGIFRSYDEINDNFPTSYSPHIPRSRKNGHCKKTKNTAHRHIHTYKHNPQGKSNASTSNYQRYEMENNDRGWAEMIGNWIRADHSYIMRMFLEIQINSINMSAGSLLLCWSSTVGNSDVWQSFFRAPFTTEWATLCGSDDPPVEFRNWNHVTLTFNISTFNYSFVVVI